MFDIGGLVPAGGTQARTSCKPTCPRNGSPTGIAEQEQPVSCCKRRGAHRGERSARRTDGLRDRILQDQLFAEGCRKIQTEMVCALQGADLRSPNRLACRPMNSCRTKKKPRTMPGAFDFAEARLSADDGGGGDASAEQAADQVRLPSQ